MSEFFEKVLDAFCFGLFIILVIIGFVMFAPANAQTYVGEIKVACDGGKSARVFSTIEAADDYAKTLPCTPNTYLKASGYYAKPKSSSGSKSSASSYRSSIQSSSSSSLPKLVELQFVPSKLKGTEIIDSSIIEYRLYRGAIVDKIKPIGNPVKFVTTPPKEGEEWRLTAFNGIESDSIVVVR